MSINDKAYRPLLEWLHPPRRFGLVTDCPRDAISALGGAVSWDEHRHELVGAGVPVRVMLFNPDAIRGLEFDRLLVVVPPLAEQVLCERVEQAARMACRSGELSVSTWDGRKWCFSTWVGAA